MINIKRISIIALILLVVGIVGSLLTFKSMTQLQEVSEEKVINEAFTQMEILTDNAEVRILPTNDPSAKLEISGNTRKNSKYNLSTNVEGSKLFIEVKDKQLSFLNFFPTLLSVTLYLPEKEYESLIVESDNGLIHIDTLQAREINAKTDNGKMELRNITGNTVTTEVSNGTSDLINVVTSKVSVNSSNGKIILDGVEGDLYGKTNNGSISLDTSTLDRSIEFTTDNGRITIRTEEEPTNATIDASVDNGKVDIFGNSTNHTTIGDGENLIKLRTDNGGIRIERK